jgi:hypothetical protein
MECIGCGKEANYVCSVCHQAFCERTGCLFERQCGAGTHHPCEPIPSEREQ